jgi:peptidoglycan/LPS O-acetylase OafA/YrhL
MSKTNGRVFDLNSTLACKGVALLLLLWHHLFYECPQYGHIVFFTATLSKVCVSMFVFLSGFGFAESIKGKNVGLFAFYKKRLVPLYFNYWLIAAIFVPFGIFVMNRSLESAFSRHALSRFLVQMSGLHMFLHGEYGYNATWWYMSVIIALVILFPFFFDLTRKYGWFLWGILLCVSLRDKVYLPVVKEWISPFALGILFSQREYFKRIDCELRRFGWWRFVFLVILVISVALLRAYGYLLNGPKIDWFFGFVIILTTWEFANSIKYIQSALSFLGEHLFNIFLFHTFIFYYFWKDFIYGFDQPVLIFAVLLVLCVAVSMIIERVKVVMGFYVATQKLQNLKVPSSIEIPFRQDAPVET